MQLEQLHFYSVCSCRPHCPADFQENNDFCGFVHLQLKAKTEMLLSAEAAKAAQKANLENNLESAQHALQDKQQVRAFFVPLMLQLG